MTLPGELPARLSWRSALGGLLMLIVAAALGVAAGPIALDPGSILAELVDRLPGVSAESGLTSRQAAVLWQIRMPRVVLAGLVGGTLSIAGAAYQGVFRNPLADPYLLGVAAGAGLGATLAIAAGASASGPVLALAAFAGGSLAVVATYALGKLAAGGATTATLILAGVAVASFFTAVQTFIQQIASDTIRQVFAWILGRLTTVGWNEVLVLLPFVAVAGTVLVASGRHLDLLAVGEDEATTLGLRTSSVVVPVVLAATLATAAAVSVSGLIGFVGIVVPHAVRRLAGSSYRIVLPLSFLGGGAFLVVADVLARTVIAPSELPIGVITAFVGAPFFALILRRARAA